MKKNYCHNKTMGTLEESRMALKKLRYLNYEIFDTPDFTHPNN